MRLAIKIYFVLGLILFFKHYVLSFAAEIPKTCESSRTTSLALAQNWTKYSLLLPVTEAVEHLLCITVEI